MAGVTGSKSQIALHQFAVNLIRGGRLYRRRCQQRSEPAESRGSIQEGSSTDLH
jgi:hypothetical protein